MLDSFPNTVQYFAFLVGLSVHTYIYYENCNRLIVLLVLPGTTTSTTTSKKNMSNKLVQPSIIIIGAGAAGISAATQLISNGLTNVTIVEAENRIGGRVHSVPFGGTTVDLGAQWVENQNFLRQS